MQGFVDHVTTVPAADATKFLFLYRVLSPITPCSLPPEKLLTLLLLPVTTALHRIYHNYGHMREKKQSFGSFPPFLSETWEFLENFHRKLLLSFNNNYCDIVLHIARFPTERIGKLTFHPFLFLKQHFPRKENKNKNMLCMEEFVMSGYEYMYTFCTVWPDLKTDWISFSPKNYF